MFTQPTYNKMKPCPYFLDAMCKFDDETCKYVCAWTLHTLVLDLTLRTYVHIYTYTSHVYIHTFIHTYIHIYIHYLYASI